ncbi:MAG: beta-L-arabinofuranosidase domain-containing protein, partial [Christensenellaceae bacterium]
MKLICTFDPGCITVEDPFLQNAFQREITYLLSLDSDRLLSSFRKNAGIATDVPPYSGWENSLIGGHTMGHYLSALAQAISASFAGDRKTELKNRLNLIVKELALCQEHSQGKEGFLWGGLALDQNVEFQFDNVEADRTDIRTEAWVPWYTMHKILSGLIDAYTLAGNKTAKKVAIGLGKWAYRRVKDLSDIKRSRILSVEYGGMNDALYRLYEITKDTDFAVAAHFFDEEILINKILD